MYCGEGYDNSVPKLDRAGVGKHYEYLISNQMRAEIRKWINDTAVDKILRGLARTNHDTIWKWAMYVVLSYFLDVVSALSYVKNANCSYHNAADCCIEHNNKDKTQANRRLNP